MKINFSTMNQEMPNLDHLEEMIFVISGREVIEDSVKFDYDQRPLFKDGLAEAINNMIRTIHVACTRNTKANITISIEGYDDDPRELWEIREVVAFVELFATSFRLFGYPQPNFLKRLTKESIKWVDATHLPPATKQ
jgi:hypothetical protein